MPGRRIQEASRILCQADTFSPELKPVEVEKAIMLVPIDGKWQHFDLLSLFRSEGLLFANLPESMLKVFLEFRNIIIQITAT